MSKKHFFNFKVQIYLLDLLWAYLFSLPHCQSHWPFLQVIFSYSKQRELQEIPFDYTLTRLFLASLAAFAIKIQGASTFPYCFMPSIISMLPLG